MGKMQLFKVLTLALVASPLALAANYGSCTKSSGASGICIKTTTCSSASGTADAGLCPGDSTIRCCSTSAGNCVTSGITGACISTTACSGTGFSQAGLCPGASNIQCCAVGLNNLPSLNAVQSTYARTIARAARTKSMPIRACQVGIATAYQESRIRVLSNPSVPASSNFPYLDGSGSDHDSVGIFQQRPVYWCTSNVFDCMDPVTSSNKFFTALQGVSNWQSLSIAEAAQAVQKSAYPDAYAQWVTLATNVCNVAWYE